MRSFVSLARWLGPWAGDRVPPSIRRDKVRVPSEGRTIDAYVYAPEGPVRGAYFIAPGLHFLGPDDTRFDRFNRVLAAAGFLVLAPFVPSYVSLVLDESAFVDARAAFSLLARRARDRGLGRPAVFSISFGSSLAFDLATHEDTRDDVGALLVFGGFAELVPTVRFAVTGIAEQRGTAVRLERDPLNAPVVFLNVLPFLEVDGDEAALAAAWRTMVRRTWNRAELKAPGMRDPFAHALAETLPPALREPFLRGCGLAPGDVAWLESGLERAGAALSFMDPGSRLERVRAPTTLVHGRADDVIPHVELEKLASRLPVDVRKGTYSTGLYGHTGAAPVSARGLVAELSALVGMLTAMASRPSG